eukprot:8092018-Prorocentrum_lima.AAC.1
MGPLSLDLELRLRPVFLPVLTLLLSSLRSGESSELMSVTSVDTGLAAGGTGTCAAARAD